MRQQPALQRPLARPDHVGDEVLEPERVERGPATAGASPVSTSSSLTPRRAARSISRSTSSGSCRCGLCVANEQYLQWQRHVRESESVTLRENVTRRIHSPPYRCACSAVLVLASSSRAAAERRLHRRSSATSRSRSTARRRRRRRRLLSPPARGYDEAEGVSCSSRRRRRRLPARRATPRGRLHRRAGAMRARRPSSCSACDAIIAGRASATKVRRRRAGAAARLHAGAARARRGRGGDGRRRSRGSTATAVAAQLDTRRADLDGGRAVLRRAAAGRARPGPSSPSAWRETARLLERGCGGTPGAPTPAGPTSASSSTRPSRTSRSTSSPAIAGVVEQLQRAVHDLRRRGVAELVGDDDVEVPVVVGVRLRVAGHEQRRGVDVAVLLDAQVELEVGPVRRAARRESPGSLRQAA